MIPAGIRLGQVRPGHKENQSVDTAQNSLKGWEQEHTEEFPLPLSGGEIAGDADRDKGGPAHSVICTAESLTLSWYLKWIREFERMRKSVRYNGRETECERDRVNRNVMATMG